MIRMDVPHDSERCSRDFHEIHAVLFPYVFVNVYDQSELIMLSIGTEN